VVWVEFAALYVIFTLWLNCRPRSHRMFLGYMDEQACIRTFMCACQDALKAEQVGSSDQHPSPPISDKSGDPPSPKPPSWIWKGNIFPSCL
jgi:hypothetical protein